MGEIFDRFEVEPQKGADITIGTRFPEIFVSDRDEIICYLGICLNEDNEESDLIFLYLDQDLIKQEIADIFQVT